MTVHDFDTMHSQHLTDRYSRKIATGEHMSVARLEARQGAITRPHRHDYEEVIILLKGRWRFTFAGKQVLLEPNQIITIPAHVDHSSEVLEDVLAIDVSATKRTDWITCQDRDLHCDPDQWLWAV